MNKTSFTVDFRIVSAVLLAVIVLMVGVWQPWKGTSKRTIDVSGEATVKSEPNAYIFYPSYEKKGTDRSTIQAELSSQVTDVIAKLKELGVSESDIALTTSTYDNYWTEGTDQVTSSSLTITLENKDLVQKVQDYLLSTSPTGQITPQASFTDAKRKTLETEARSAAITDAKAKAERTASELGMKLGKVVTISDPQSGIIMPMAAEAKSSIALDATSGSTSLPILSGKQEVNYNIQVTYELK